MKPPSKLSHTVRDTPGNTLAGAVHREVRQSEDDNVGVKSTHRLEEAAEAGGRLAQRSYRAQKLKPYREAAKAERRLEKANVNALYQKHIRDNPQLSSNPISRMQQKRVIRKQYAASVRSGQSAAATVENTARAAKKAAEKSMDGMNFILRHKKGIGIIAGLLMCACLLLNCMSSCSILAEGLLSSMGSATFPCADEDMLGAEAAYAAMESDLQNYLDTYTSTHSYDEYHFDLDEIKHDPYVLISLLTAYHGGTWTLPDVLGTLDMLFDRQYILTETVTSETRYNADGEPYIWTVCNVKLVNFDLSHLPVYLLDENGMSIYANYMAGLGNRPDLFPTGAYPNASQRQDYLDYDVPPEALADAQFAAMLAEAEKYLGYPYVWGGSSPSTSFDCSGFVSWVINHSGWNVGRLGAQGLCNICTPVSPANAQPGDLVFFKYTYNAPDPDGVTHCGIYVGNGMMIHCGSPISYANLNSSYWQQHFYTYCNLSFKSRFIIYDKSRIPYDYEKVYCSSKFYIFGIISILLLPEISAGVFLLKRSDFYVSVSGHGEAIRSHEHRHRPGCKGSGRRLHGGRRLADLLVCGPSGGAVRRGGLRFQVCQVAAGGFAHPAGKLALHHWAG